MTKKEKNEVIQSLQTQFSTYSNFYITDTQALSVAQVNKLRRACFEKNVVMKVAKNTLIKKALERLDAEKYSPVFESLHNVSALMFTVDEKEPAFIISKFRTDNKFEKPVLKSAFIDGAVFVGDNQLEALKTIRGKKEMLGEVITILQSPAKNVISGLNAGTKLASLVKAVEESKAAS